MKKVFLMMCLILLAPQISFSKEKAKAFPESRKVETKSELKPHVGVLFGVSHPTDGYENAGEFGLDVGFQPYIPFGLGLEYSTARIEKDNGGINQNNLLLKGSYNFGGDIKVLKESYVGLGLGASFKDNRTDFVTAPLLGFDIPMNPENKDHYLSLGAMAKYVMYDSEDPDNLSLTAMIKYWY